MDKSQMAGMYTANVGDVNGLTDADVLHINDCKAMIKKTMAAS
jgi:hypothetical protein